jgi:inhibitor of cysteine peptidase
MSTKFILTLITLVVMISLAGCGAKTTTPAQNDQSSAATQPSPSGTSAGEYNADNEIMLPIISGKVANVTLDAMADGTTQQLKKGEVMVVSLESNPSTGYAWVATITDPKVLVQMGEPQYQEPSSSSSNPVVGAAGTQTFFFQAAETGSTTLTLEYKRGWEDTVAPEKTVTIYIEVK